MFTRNSAKKQCLGNFNLKLQWWRAAIFCLRNPWWWLQLWPSSLNVPLVWFLNLLGVKVLILNLLKVQQATISEFLWKLSEMERAMFLDKKERYRATANLYMFDLMLFQFGVTTVILIKFIQNSDLNRKFFRKVFRKF